jgi:hypothetical protein
MVCDLHKPAANGAIPLAGIRIDGGTTVNAYYNTVYLNSTSTGALFGSAALYASTTPAVTLRNNILVNTSAPTGSGITAAYRRSNTTLTSYGSASNNNCLYSGTPSATNVIFYDGTNSYQTLAEYQALVTPRDNVSVTEMPPFVNTMSPMNLHINTTIPTLLESGGYPIPGYTNDYDGDIRNITTPDIGADEFVGQPIFNFSVTASAINVTCNGGSDGAINISVIGGTPPYDYEIISPFDCIGLICEWPSVCVNGNCVYIATGSEPFYNLLNIRAGNYTITVTDFNGFTGTTSASITEPPVLSISTTVINNVSCYGYNDGSIGGFVVGGTPPYQAYLTIPLFGCCGLYHCYVPFSCDPNCICGAVQVPDPLTGTWLFENLKAAQYTLEITDANGCTVLEEFTITEPPSQLIIYNALDHNSLGCATLEVINNDTLKVDNIGASGLDGFSADVANYPYLALWGIDTEMDFDQMAEGSSINVTSMGTVSGIDSQVISIANYEKAGDSINAFVDFTAVETSEVNGYFFLNGEMVHQEIIQSGSFDYCIRPDENNPKKVTFKISYDWKNQNS